ncbi:MAG: hypothetical protein F4Y58_04420, partial [Gammaproteobacteria bacterium]|nr:hypothetical protein [Gammaproteobacteria bacterium]
MIIGVSEEYRLKPLDFRYIKVSALIKSEYNREKPMPQTEARHRHQLKVDDLHKLTIKEYGSEEGYPVV